MDGPAPARRRRNSSGGSRTSAIESAGLCPSCRGSGLRSTTGLWVALDALGISMALQLTSPRAWSPWTRRSLLAFVASVVVAVGLPTWILDLLVDR